MKRKAKPPVPRRKAGRPLLVPPKDAEQRIEAFAANGASMVGIARALGVGKDTLARWLDEAPDLREALDRGRETERALLHNALFRAATEGGNIIAAMFLLKSRHGYREGDQSESANKVQVTFALPGALPMEKFIKDETNDRATTTKRLPATIDGSAGTD